MGELNIDTLSPEELENVQVTDDGEVLPPNAQEDSTPEDGEKDKQPAEQEEGSTTGEGEKEKGKKEEGDETEEQEAEGTEEGAEEEQELNHKGKPKKDPLKETKAALTKLQQERAELRKQLALERQKRIEAQLKSFQKLSDEEKEELKQLDPEAYIEYIEKEKQIEEQERALQQDKENERLFAQRDEIEKFLIEAFGVDVDMSKSLEEQPEAIQKWAKSGKFEKIDQWLLENMKPNEQGVFTAEQLNAAYKALFFDEIVTNVKKGVREQTVEDIERASKGGSQFDRTPKGDRSQLKAKRLEDLTQEDIDSMSEEELARFEAEYGSG